MLDVCVAKTFAQSRERAFRLEAAFEAGDGITVLFGPSGAGKTTVLRAVAGIVTPDSGRIAAGSKIFFDSEAGINLPIQRRRVGYVFQDYLLFPHLTAEENVIYALRNGRAKRSERRERARAILAQFGIADLHDRYPQSLSGGEQQRTALARALASGPEVVVLDEPLSAVDVETRSRLLDEIQAAQSMARVPFIYVTHNREEAVRLGTHAVVLDRGRVTRTGSPLEVFQAAEL